MITIPFSIMKEKLYEFLNNLKTQILSQEKNKIFIEKHTKHKIAICETKKIISSEDEWIKKCNGEFKIKISTLLKEFKTEIIEIIKDLEKVYKTINEASAQLESILKYPLIIQSNKYNHDISIEKIHKKVFLKIIQSDNFIRSLIVEVNSNENNFFNDLKNLIKNCEVEITQSCNLSDKECSDDDSCCEIYLSEEKSDENNEQSILDFKDNLMHFNEIVKLSVK
jgi:hypothetical protein